MKPFSEGFSGEKKRKPKKEFSESDGMEAEGSFIIRSSESDSLCGSENISREKHSAKDKLLSPRASKTVPTDKKGKGKSAKSSKFSHFSESKSKRHELESVDGTAHHDEHVGLAHHHTNTTAASTTTATAPLHHNTTNKTSAPPNQTSAKSTFKAEYSPPVFRSEPTIPTGDHLLSAFERERQTTANKITGPALEIIVQNITQLNQQDPNITNNVVETLLLLLAMSPNASSYHVAPKNYTNADVMTSVLLEKWQGRVAALERKEDFDYAVDTSET